MSPQEFIEKRDANTAEFIRQQKENSFDIKRFHGFDVDGHDVPTIQLLSKCHDIFGAVVMGALPILNDKFGVDAYILSDTTFKPMEIKTTYTNVDSLVKTESGTVYKVIGGQAPVNNEITKSKLKTVTSCLNASLVPVTATSHVRYSDVYLLAATNNGSIIDCYSLESEIAINKISKSQANVSNKRRITLTYFTKYGKPVDTVIPKIGLKNWLSDVSKSIPLVKLTY